MANLDQNRVTFLRGVLAAFASNGQVVHYNEIRRLCRLTQEQLGVYLDAARSQLVSEGQPDFCAIVVNEGGWPGDGWAKGDKGTDSTEWAKELRRVHRFWQNRRALDNAAFAAEHGQLPATPGLDGGD